MGLKTNKKGPTPSLVSKKLTSMLNEINEMFKEYDLKVKIYYLVEGSAYVDKAYLERFSAARQSSFGLIASDIYKSTLKSVLDDPRVILWKNSLSDETKLFLELN